MNEKYVTSLELSKQLKEAGIEQKAEHYWLNTCSNPDGERYTLESIDSDTPFNSASDQYAAFCTDELLEKLPSNTFQYENKKYGWAKWGLYKLQDFSDNSVIWSINIGFCDYGDEILWESEADSPCNALAKLLLHLTEQGLIPTAERKE